MLKANYLRAKFIQSGGEGAFTRLMNSPDEMGEVFSQIKITLEENEEPLIWYHEEDRYLLVTNQRLIFQNRFTNNEQAIFDLTQLKGVNEVIQEQEVVSPPFRLTVFAITDFAGNRYLLKVEAHRAAFGGIYQLLYAAIKRNWVRLRKDGTVL